LKNLSLGEKLCNGSIGRVVRFTNGHKYPIVRFVSGIESMIKPERFVLRGGAGDSAQRVQIPLELGWNFSVHRSQGMSLDRVQMSLGSVFEYGQAYVALSRAKSMEGLRLLDFEAKCVRAHPAVIEFYRRLGHRVAEGVEDFL
jgi:ATP-dependent DNA helicase PIF1